MCISEDCPLAANAACSMYEAVVEPAEANSSNTEPTATMSGVASGTSASPTGSSTGNAAVVHGVGLAAVIGGVAAMFL